MYNNFYPNSNIIWVHGEQGAKTYPSMNAILMDSEEKCFYIKSTDASGMPLPMRVFDYTERLSQTPQQINDNYIAREDVEQMISQLKTEFEEKINELTTKRTRKEKTDE